MFKGLYIMVFAEFMGKKKNENHIDKKDDRKLCKEICIPFSKYIIKYKNDNYDNLNPLKM